MGELVRTKDWSKTGLSKKKTLLLCPSVVGKCEMRRWDELNSVVNSNWNIKQLLELSTLGLRVCWRPWAWWWRVGFLWFCSGVRSSPWSTTTPTFQYVSTYTTTLIGSLSSSNQNLIRTTVGMKHPNILGRTGKEGWSEIWHIVQPMLQQVMETGLPTWSDDQLLILNRNNVEVSHSIHLLQEFRCWVSLYL